MKHPEYAVQAHEALKAMHRKTKSKNTSKGVVFVLYDEMRKRGIPEKETMDYIEDFAAEVMAK